MFKAAISVAAVVAFSVASAGSLITADDDVQFDFVTEELQSLWEEYHNGGTVTLSTPRGEVSLLLEVSSVFQKGDPTGNYTADGTPILPMVVLRGAGDEGTYGAMVLQPTRAALVINTAWGEVIRANIPPLLRPEPGTVVPPEYDNETIMPPDVAPKELQIRGPLVATVETRMAQFPGNDTEAPSTAAVEVMHVRPQGGHSIHITRHDYKTDLSVNSGPINVIFFDQATGSKSGSIMTSNGWDVDSCGTPKKLWFDDGGHGGSVQWQGQHPGSDQHYEKGGVWWCSPDERYHMRKYASATGDFHSDDPSVFGHYSPANIHWDDKDHENSDAHKGQNMLLGEMLNDPDIDDVWLFQLPYSTTECGGCAKWQGWVDMYQIYGVFGQNSCGEKSDVSWVQYGGWASHTDWRCS